ncbi:MAG: hypothetical protein A2Y07_10470 [Planctomycetes bacterium GWF2_50_10]|nr:MAG: hypothetical protein A2Y07_10470 [Planctomycetes bacterium GWF2_50_10]
MSSSKSKSSSQYGTSQLFNFARDSYLERTSRPIYSLVYLIPFIVIYEIGTVLVNTDELRQSLRVVSFVWLKELLEWAGFGSNFAFVAAPLAVVVILLALQITSRTKWSINLKDLMPMMGECAMLAIPLIVLSLLLNRPAAPNAAQVWQCQAKTTIAKAPMVTKYQAVGVGQMPATPKAPAKSTSPLLANIITGIGAGIYEELIFRLIFITLLMLLLFDVVGMDHSTALLVSVFISAGLFSAHHHIIFIDGRFATTAAFSWTAFIFRTLAGVYFAGLFAVRGFGITAGTHAFYDIIAAVLNSMLFSWQNP